MLVREAKAAARRGVAAEGAGTPGFLGAFFQGSANWLADDAALAATSDLDILIVVEGPEPATKPGKFVHDGALREVSYLPADQVRTPEQVLGVSHLAGSFRSPGVIADPTGHLAAIQAAAARDYARRPASPTW